MEKSAMKRKCEKVAYGSKAFAENDIARIKNKSIRDTQPQRAYKCEKCGLWHLTSKPLTIMWHGKRIQIQETRRNAD